MEQKFYICKHCGNIITMVKPTGVPVMCCGEKMAELVPGEVDAATEKHVPVYEVEDGKVIVKIGEVAHPMTEENLIEWVAVQTKQGFQVKKLAAEHEPESWFKITDCDEVEAVYAYCNLHGLWKK